MRHARIDYDRIQDPLGLIPENEPVFLLRGQDILAPETVEYWAALAEERGDVAPEFINGAYQFADAMRDWQSSHRSKIPDVPVGAMRY